MIRLMSVWTSAITPAISRVATPIRATSDWMSGAFSKRTCVRAIR